MTWQKGENHHMMLKNTLKLSFTNFKQVWKMLLFRICYLLCVLGLTTVFASNIIEALIKENFFVNLKQSFKELAFNLDFSKMFGAINSLTAQLVDVIKNGGFVARAILCGIFAVFFCAFFEAHGRMALHTSINGYMNSMVQYGFANSFVSNFGKATQYALANMVTELPITLAILVGTYFFASGLYSKLGMFSVVIACILLITFLSLEKALFCGWLPALVINGEGIFRSLAKSAKSTAKYFGKTFLAFAILVCFGVMCSLFSVTFTLGIGLVIVLPAWAVIDAIFGQVCYYECYGMRYYVDSDEIISPKRLEQQDKFAKVKDII